VTPKAPRRSPPSAPRDGEVLWPELAIPLTALPGVGPARARSLRESLGLRTVADLLRHVPRRHEDRSRIMPVAAAVPGAVATLRGTVLDLRDTAVRPGLRLLHARVADGTGVVRAVWFNRLSLRRVLRPGVRVYLSGRVERRGPHLEMVAPEVELDSGSDPLHTGRIVPVYPLAGRVGQRTVRAAARVAVARYADQVPEWLPAPVREALQLADAASAWRDIHFPADPGALEAARRRLVFEQLLALQLALALRRRRVAGAVRGFAYRPPGALTARFRQSLPYRLTAAQERVLGEIEADLRGTRPMQRLLQGDVGSGKTVVAAATLLRAVESGRQGALMAPTEVLAEQHAWQLRRLLGPLGVPLALLSGSLPRTDREAALEAVRTGRAAIAVGTHALIQEGVSFAALGLVVTDEQHRFGVRQRALLAAKGENPDALVMTATPIPRTLALTLYGDLDVSVLDQMPPGRHPVRTFWRPPEARRRVYAFVRDQIAAGRQAYVVCPLVEEGDDEAASATRWADRLRRALPGVSVGLLHGRLPAAEKERVMTRFADGRVQLLVATTVIEVGIDVPNAAVIVVEGADRFGLAQLHQLRGRVGRGPHPSFCILIAAAQSEEAQRRMRILERTSDGFAIAEQDLLLRGPGELLGTRQHGLPELPLADLTRDLRFLEAARDWAAAILERDPDLSAPEHQGLRRAAELHLRGGPGATA
jgi:ATP-dependent DNA helicase RecG